MTTSTSGVDAILFDFDGVILDTVRLKGEAFCEIMKIYAPGHVDEAMDYFWRHGGTSRLDKLRNIFDGIVNRPLEDQEIQALGEEFVRRVYDKVVRCPYVLGAEEFLTRYSQTWQCYVISGTPQDELRSIVRDRGMGHFFAGVYGSPKKKAQIGNLIIEENDYNRERVWFVGDATTDRDAAAELGVRFVGLSGPHLDPYLQGWETTIDDLGQLHAVLTGDHVG